MRLVGYLKRIVFNNAYGFPQKKTVRTLRDGGKPVGEEHFPQEATKRFRTIVVQCWMFK
jgi:hypothetical protein